MKNCNYCTQFNKMWLQLKKHKSSTVSYLKINGEENEDLKKKYKIKKYPSIIKIKNNKKILFRSERTMNKLKQFIK